MKILQTYVRVYVNEIDSAVDFYENLLGVKSDLRFQYPEVGLELASVGHILILAGTDESLAPFKATKATFKVDSIEEFQTYLINSGALILRGPQRVPTGTNMTVKHPDGSIFEYVEHHK
ncbi:dioxygenase [Collibacillus ludicampi]|uniref:Dioxygenase n=1 Tax=Collibacillus ludicampi TaxID=2771369 RepID=A0AAV4LIC9_9BACL|nr:VOC family protein [Collibacillus ludicampi]GIM47606.1 dioxygenase [Collibacillus ludicampi]